MNFINADVTDTVNPYITDLGVGLVFGLGYYLIKYLYGEHQTDGKEGSKHGRKIAQVMFDSAKTIHEFNHLIKLNEEDPKMNPFEILDKINKKQLSPDINTFNTLLNACYTTRNFGSADKLIEELFDYTSPVQPDLSTFNIMLKGVSCKCDQIQNSDEKLKLMELTENIFSDILNHAKGGIMKPNEVTINTLLDIMIKVGEITKAWDLFDSMKEKYNVEADKYTYSTILKAFRYELDPTKLEKVFKIFEYLKNKGESTIHDEMIYNNLIDVCLKLKIMDKAEKALKEMKEIGVTPSKITYAIIIRGYGQVYNLEKAIQIFEEMKLTNIPPNEIIYGCLLNACVRCANIEKLTEIYLEMKQHDLDMNIVLYTTLIKAYTKVKNLKLALEVYETMLKDQNVNPNIVIHNAMLDCCVECNDFTKMNEIYENIKQKAYKDENSPQPDLITYSTVIKGYAKAKDMNKVFHIYEFLTYSTDFVLDEVVYNSILDGCAKTKDYERAKNVYNDMKKNEIKKSNVTYSIIIKLYANSKKEKRALKVLNDMKSNGIQPGIIVYTCLIQTCLRSRRFEKALKLFENLKEDGLKPDHVLYNTIIKGCILNRELKKACKYTLESFNVNVRMATSICKTLLDKLTRRHSHLKTDIKCEYATKILTELKEKGIHIDDKTYQKVARMIYKKQGVKIDLQFQKSNRKSSNLSNCNIDEIYSCNNYNNFWSRGLDKKDYNKDQLKFQREGLI